MSNASVRTELVTKDQAFEALGPSWSSLLAQSGSDSIFLTHEWLWAWWRHFSPGRRLCIIRFLDEDGPVGFAPLVIVEEPGTHRPRKVEFLGEPFSDLHDLLVTQRRRECVAAMFDALAEWAPEASYLELRLIPDSSPNLSALRDTIPEKLWLIEAPLQVRERSAPGITLRGDWETYLQDRAASLRTDLRRQRRRLSALGHLSIVRHDDPAAIRTCLDQLAAFSQARFPTGNAYHDPLVKRFYEDVAMTCHARGWLHASSLLLDDMPIAVHFGFAYQRTFHYYQPAINQAFQTYSPGKILLELLIERAFADGMQRVDLGRGAERYKDAWATDTVRLHRFEAVPRRITPIGRWLLRRTRYVADALRSHS